MEADIRIMELNTSLKCGRLGAIGRPLSVIAQALRDCGGRTATLAAAVLAALQQLLAAAASLTDTRHAPDAAAGGEVGHDMMQAVERLNATGQRLGDALAGLEDDSDAVGGLLATAVERFTVRHEISKVLRQAAADCTLLAEPADGPDAAEDAASCAGILSQIAAGYTMACERAVHARFAPSSESDQAAPDAAETELADLLF